MTEDITEKFAIVTVESGGAYAGTIVPKSDKFVSIVKSSKYIEMHNGIRMLPINSKAKMNQIMKMGSSPPKAWKFYKPVSLVIILDFIEVLDCPPELEDLIKNQELLEHELSHE
jgi:hypothetical protein